MPRRFVSAERISRTATLVGLARGIAARPTLADPTAALLLPRPLGWALRRLEPHPPLRALARALSLGLVDHLTLRTAAIDRELQRWIGQAGLRQLVVLGAGFDGRAWRLEVLRDCTVYEVDRLGTIALKRHRVRGRPPKARQVRFVAVDFEQRGLGPPLQRAGHHAEQPTVWLWEGVTQYLSQAAVAATLAELADRSAPGSVLLMTYSRPELVPGGPWARWAVLRLFELLGEPLCGPMPPEEVEALLRGVGFERLEDTDSRHWAATLGLPARPASLFRYERLVVARKRGP